MSDTTPGTDPVSSDPTAPPPPPADPVAPSADHPAPESSLPAAAPEHDSAPAADAVAPYPLPDGSSAPAPPYLQPAPAYPPPAQAYPPPAPAYPPPAQAYPPPAPAYPPPAQAYPATAAPLDPTQERQWGMLAHIIGGVGFATTAVGGFIGTLVVYLIYKDRGPFVRAHAANSLNVQITTFIGLVVGVITAFFIIGFFILLAVAVWTVVVHIIGAIKANNGEWYDPPLAITFVR
ncbi:MAG: DUF4870 domain-containing protein [Dermatophilaceae bacterium]